jgi:hypothetical protein
MIDENVIDSLQVQTPEVEATPVETPTEEPKIDQAAVEKRAEELYQARNFKTLRSQAEQLARERDEYRRLYETSRQAPQEVDPDDDAYIEKKHLKQTKRQLDEQYAKLAQQQQELQASIIEQNIRSRCPDFESVVTEDTLAKLRNEYPEVAATLNSSPDVQSKAIAAYKLIKKLGVHNPEVEAEKAIIAKNAAKPKVSAVLPQSGDLSRANAFERGMTDAEKEEVFKRAQEFAMKA